MRIAIVVLILGTACVIINNAYSKNAISPYCKQPALDGSQMAFWGCSPDIAFKRAKVLAEKGNPQELYILGRVYELSGRTFGLPHIKSNLNLAQHYYLQAARKGDVDAQARLGWMYRKYFRNTKDQEGFFWLCKSAMQENKMAIGNLQDHITYIQSDESWQHFCAPILAKGEPN